MKKTLLFVVAGALFFASCQKTTPAQEEKMDELTAVGERRHCAAHDVLDEQIKNDPSLRQRMDAIERFTKDYVARGEGERLSGDTMIIPVIVNVLFRSTTENISLGQIQSQIAVLNEDFSATNADITSIPSAFSAVRAGDTKIRFVLEQVIRKSTTKRSWSTNDDMKRSTRGGINPTSPTTKLNIWVCTLGNGILGYAQFPGGSSATDGVVVLNRAFGSRAKFPSGFYTTTFDRGRTATHEVGHWLNLRHIWGDATCGNDFVGDTPLHTTANNGCPAANVRSTCSGTPIMMTMNYMDYTNDACMYMFSAGQRTRMAATWAVGGPRASFR
jgi:hypothetical protein